MEKSFSHEKSHSTMSEDGKSPKPEAMSDDDNEDRRRSRSLVRSPEDERRTRKSKSRSPVRSPEDDRRKKIASRSRSRSGGGKRGAKSRSRSRSPMADRSRSPARVRRQILHTTHLCVRAAKRRSVAPHALRRLRSRASGVYAPKRFFDATLWHQMCRGRGGFNCDPSLWG
jgi:hypothetical protein